MDNLQSDNITLQTTNQPIQTYQPIPSDAAPIPPIPSNAPHQKKVKIILLTIILLLSVAVIAGTSWFISSKKPIAPTAPQDFPKAEDIRPTINLATEIEKSTDKIPEKPSSITVACGDPDWTKPIISGQGSECFDPIFSWNQLSAGDLGSVQGYNVYWKETRDPITFSMESGETSVQPFFYTTENSFRPYEFMKMETGKTYYLFLQALVDNSSPISRSDGEMVDRSKLILEIQDPVYTYVFSGTSPDPETVDWLPDLPYESQ